MRICKAAEQRTRVVLCQGDRSVSQEKVEFDVDRFCCDELRCNRASEPLFRAGRHTRATTAC